MTYPLLGKLSLYWNTLRYIRWKQFVGRLKYYFRWSKAKYDFDYVNRSVIKSWIKPAPRVQKMLGHNKFCFLNESYYINSQKDWNSSQCSKLWLYNLHYFDDLNAVNASKRTKWHFDLINRWSKENPPGYGNGWEPYPISLRVVNWIKWCMAGNELNENSLNSIMTQTNWLNQNLETHLLGNHLFSNAKALCFTGLFFDGDEPNYWYRQGLKLIENQIPEQVLSDGGNFELSPMYHIIFLEDLLDLFNIHRVYDKEQPKGLEQCIPLMLNWLENMCHPDGEISFFNDTALGVTPSVPLLREYASRLGFKPLKQKNPEIRIVDLNYSGYSRVETSDAVAIIDRAAIGPDYLPAHAHADTLSFELSLFGKRVIVNSGTSLYEEGEQRQLERGSASHSTLVIDGENSSEVWSGFRVAKRAKVFERIHSEENGFLILSAAHDGYKRLPGKPIHQRQWFFEKKCLLIKDTITGKGIHDIEIIFPIHPNVSIKEKQKNNITMDVDGHSIKFVIEGERSIKLVSAKYYPEFGVSQDNYQIVYKVNKSLPIEIKSRISW